MLICLVYNKEQTSSTTYSYFDFFFSIFFCVLLQGADPAPSRNRVELWIDPIVEIEPLKYIKESILNVISIWTIQFLMLKFPATIESKVDSITSLISPYSKKYSKQKTAKGHTNCPLWHESNSLFLILYLILFF